MKCRFIIALDAGSKIQNDAFLEYLKSKGFGWWHWIDNFWLVDPGNNPITASDIRDRLCLTHPDVNNIVIELRHDGSDTWAGFGPSSDTKNMFKWLLENWSKK